MLLRLSRFVHVIPITDARFLVVDAVSHVRMAVDRDVADLIGKFTTPQEVPDQIRPDGVIAKLAERGILTRRTPDEELAHVTGLLAPLHGRDPDALLQKFRRQAKEGGEPYWAAGAALGLSDFEGTGRRVDVILLGDCDMHMESDFLRREAAARGLDLRVAATFPDDLRFAGEHKHDAVMIGALRSRHTLMDQHRPDLSAPPHAEFVQEARALIEGLRQQTAAPILIDGMPEPTVQPLGFAERGPRGHRNRFRAANIALAELVENYPDVHMVDMAAVLAAAGSERLLDDGDFGYTHFGSPGWLLQRAENEKAAVHGQFPDLAPLAARLDGDPYAREAVTARAHLDALTVVLGLDAKKCVIVDLDGVLWPGVLAETGSPFAFRPEDNHFSYVGLYFGLHEALLSLKKRGILLACVSKNDEATVRELWKYQDHDPRWRLLTPDDFVTLRMNWNDKVENIRSIAGELGLALETFLFIDDNPVERERVRQRLPEVEVWGDDPFALRRRLLSDPRLQQPRLTEEAAARTVLTKSQLGRQAARVGAPSESEFLASLNVRTQIQKIVSGGALDRILELFQRTTQFNATGIKPSRAELETLLQLPDGGIYVAHVNDRFGDHGLVGAAVIREGDIIGLVLSCRVLGLGVEHVFLQRIMTEQGRPGGSLRGRIVPTARNNPVRNIYRDNGFALGEDGFWRLPLSG